MKPDERSGLNVFPANVSRIKMSVGKMNKPQTRGKEVYYTFDLTSVTVGF